MNWLDAGIIIFAIILIIIGITRGFMTSMLSNFTFSINALVSFFLYKPIQMIFNNWFYLGDKIANSYSEKLISASSDFSVNLMDISSADLGKFVNEALGKGNLPGISRTMFRAFLNRPTLYDTLHASSHTSRTLSDIISTAYSNFFTTVIAFVTCMVLLYAIFLIINFIVNRLRKVGFIRIVDGILGSFYGLIRCLIILIIISMVIKIISPLSFMEGVINYINGSFFGRLIYNQISSFADNYLNFSRIIQAIFK